MKLTGFLQKIVSLLESRNMLLVSVRPPCNEGLNSTLDVLLDCKSHEIMVTGSEADREYPSGSC